MKRSREQAADAERPTKLSRRTKKNLLQSQRSGVPPQLPTEVPGFYVFHNNYHLDLLFTALLDGPNGVGQAPQVSNALQQLFQAVAPRFLPLFFILTTSVLVALRVGPMWAFVLFAAKELCVSACEQQFACELWKRIEPRAAPGVPAIALTITADCPREDLLQYATRSILQAISGVLLHETTWDAIASKLRACTDPSHLPAIRLHLRGRAWVAAFIPGYGDCGETVCFVSARWRFAAGLPRP